MTTLEQLETKHNFTFPKLYKTLFEADMTNWMRGFELPLEKGKTWADDVYPTQHGLTMSTLPSKKTHLF